MDLLRCPDIIVQALACCASAPVVTFTWPLDKRPLRTEDFLLHSTSVGRSREPLVANCKQCPLRICTHVCSADKADFEYAYRLEQAEWHAD